MKIGVLSDTHLHRSERDLRLVFDQYLVGVDLILHAGDYVSSDIIAFLRRKPFHGVQGNMDSVEVKRSLPAKKVIEIAGYRIGLIHGWGSPEGLEDRILNEFRDVDAVVYGHSHKPANHVKEGVLLFNPGTITGFSKAGIHTFGILECGDTLHGEIIEVDGPH
jgi:putative phosphoesterase